METLHGNIKLVDDDSSNRIDDLQIEYNRRLCIEKVIKNADGAVAFDLSDIGAMVALYIHTTGHITIDAGTNIELQNDFMLLNAAFVETFTITNPETADVTVSIRAYGTVA